MPDNQLKQPIYLLATLLSALLLLYMVPPFSAGQFDFKKINILADIQPDEPVVETKKDTAKVTVKKNLPPVKRGDCPPKVTCLEDYSDHGNALKNFFNALKDTKNRAVRIAFFGDSFIEGDILSASLRDTLQRVFGGHGVGYVPITSQAASFRTSIRHTFSGWKTYWAVGEKSLSAPLGLSGYCFVPEADNEVEYKPGTGRNNHFFQTRLFYVSSLPCSVRYTLNDTISFAKPLTVSDTIQKITLPLDDAKSVKLRFEPVDSLRVYGASFEEGAGVYVDNFAMRGNSGMGLLQVSTDQLLEFNHFQNYKLILLQYGLNVVTEKDTLGYDWYAEKMIRVIDRLKEHFPESSIIMMGISDRSVNNNGKFVTMPNVIVMRDAQREAARRSKIVFWDLYEAMGGENSMVKFVEGHPPLAGKDYTHLNFSGGRILAKKFADALLYERSKKNVVKKSAH